MTLQNTQEEYPDVEGPIGKLLIYEKAIAMSDDNQALLKIDSDSIVLKKSVIILSNKPDTIVFEVINPADGSTIAPNTPQEILSIFWTMSELTDAPMSLTTLDL